MAGMPLPAAPPAQPAPGRNRLPSIKPIGVVMQTTDVAIDFSQFPAFRVYADNAAGVDDLKSGEIDEFFVILPDYLSTGQVEYYFSNDDGEGRQRLRLILRDALLGQTQSPEHKLRALSRPQFERYTVAENGAIAEESGLAVAVSFVVGQGFAIALIFTLIAYGTILLQTVSEEKENRMVEVLLTSASPLAIMTGKVLALGLAGLIQMAVWIGAVIIIVPRIAGVIPDIGAIPLDFGFLAPCAGVLSRRICHCGGAHGRHWRGDHVHVGGGPAERTGHHPAGCAFLCHAAVSL